MKKGNYLLIIVGALLMLGSASCTYYSNPEDPGFVIPQPPEPAYVGSETCQACHENIYDNFAQSGHPYILSEVEGGAVPSYPNTTLSFVPPHFTNGWNDVSYVIGGFAWKYQFVDDDGYIYTGDDAQYNFASGMPAPYHPGVAPGTKEFDCGACHTTGWLSVDDGGSPQGGLAGMDGEFFAAGVQCEACHGMGSVHAFTASSSDIVIDSDAMACGTCHSRNSGAEISAADGFILNYSQYDELSAGSHSELSCVACHDPHASVQHGSTAGIIRNCTECHSDINNPTHNGADCITCHMPHASKSAYASNKYSGDIKTHIFKINTAADAKLIDGETANGADGVTLGYVCYQCHRDARGDGGSNTYKSLEELSDYATNYHE